MKWTTVLRQAPKPRSLKSLALTVHFKTPDLGMKEHDILCRASAFLLGVDPPEASDAAIEGPYGHLEVTQKRREDLQFLHEKGYSSAGGAGRFTKDMGWLEFAPREVRPNVHIVASSHVLAPFLWQDYYPHTWLKQVKAEHCTFTLEVFDPAKPGKALVKLALNDSSVFHHPHGRDIALVHFKEEQSSLKILKGLGVDILHFRHLDKLYQKGEDVIFDGFIVDEPKDLADREDVGNRDEINEDLRIFYPYRQEGKLAFHTNDRFYATTSEPLPEGLCGAPVLDNDGELCGTVEGIVPVNHKDQRLAGCAAFMPSYVMKAFVDYVERGLLQQMMPEDLFESVANNKEAGSIGGALKKAVGSLNDEEGHINWDEVHAAHLQILKERYTQEAYDALLKEMEKDRKEVIDILDREGGDLDEIIQNYYKNKTLQTIEDEVRKGQQDPASSRSPEDEAPSNSTA